MVLLQVNAVGWDKFLCWPILLDTKLFNYLELLRIELRTSRMQSERSTTELQPPIIAIFKNNKINIAYNNFYFDTIL